MKYQKTLLFNKLLSFVFLPLFFITLWCSSALAVPKVVRVELVSVNTDQSDALIIFFRKGGIWTVGKVLFENVQWHEGDVVEVPYDDEVEGEEVGFVLMPNSYDYMINFRQKYLFQGERVYRSYTEYPATIKDLERAYIIHAEGDTNGHYYSPYYHWPRVTWQIDNPNVPGNMNWEDCTQTNTCDFDYDDVNVQVDIYDYDTYVSIYGEPTHTLPLMFRTQKDANFKVVYKNAELGTINVTVNNTPVATFTPEDADATEVGYLDIFSVVHVQYNGMTPESYRYVSVDKTEMTYPDGSVLEFVTYTPQEDRDVTPTGTGQFAYVKTVYPVDGSKNYHNYMVSAAGYIPELDTYYMILYGSVFYFDSDATNVVEQDFRMTYGWDLDSYAEEMIYQSGKLIFWANALAITDPDGTRRAYWRFIPNKNRITDVDVDNDLVYFWIPDDWFYGSPYTTGFRVFSADTARYVKTIFIKDCQPCKNGSRVEVVGNKAYITFGRDRAGFAILDLTTGSVEQEFVGMDQVRDGVDIEYNYTDGYLYILDSEVEVDVFDTEGNYIYSFPLAEQMRGRLTFTKDGNELLIYGNTPIATIEFFERQ